MPIPTIASASSVTLGGSPIYEVTGTSTINTINGLKTGQEVILLPAAAFVLGTSGNINAQTATATVDRPVRLVCVDAELYEIGRSDYYPGGTDVAIADGGTGQSTATAAFDALAPTTTGGDLIYHNGTDNVRLAKGTASQGLRMNSGATAPEWANQALSIYYPVYTPWVPVELETTADATWKIPNGVQSLFYLKMTATAVPSSARFILQYDGNGITDNEAGLVVASTISAPGDTVTPIASSVHTLSSNSGSALTATVTVPELGTSDVWVQLAIKNSAMASGPTVSHAALVFYY